MKSPMKGWNHLWRFNEPKASTAWPKIVSIYVGISPRKFSVLRCLQRNGGCNGSATLIRSKDLRSVVQATRRYICVTPLEFLEGLKCLSEEEKDPLYSGIWLRIHFIVFDDVCLHFKDSRQLPWWKTMSMYFGNIQFQSMEYSHWTTPPWFVEDSESPRLTQCSPVMIMIRLISPSSWWQLHSLLKTTCCAKTRVWEGLQFAIPSMLRKIRPVCIRMWKQMPTTVVPAKLPGLTAGGMWRSRSRWYEEFYWVYSICISLNSHRPFYWDPFARDGPVIGLWQALLPCTARILHSDLAGLPSGVPSWSEEGRWYWWSRKFQTHGQAHIRLFWHLANYIGAV